MITDAAPAPYETEPEGSFIERAQSGAEKVGIAFAVGAVLYQIFKGKKAPQRSRRRKK